MDDPEGRHSGSPHPLTSGPDRAAPPAFAAEASEVVRAFGGDADQGLSEAEAAHRLDQYGRNMLRARKAVPAWRRLLAQFRDPLIYLLLGAVAISLASWVINGGEGWPIDATVITAILFLNAVLGFVQESKAAGAVAALARMTEAAASVVREGIRRRIPSAELVPGDLLLLEEGDAVGADARLIEAAALRVQEASLTGESEPIPKNPAPVAAGAGLGDRSSMVFKGTAVVRGSGRAVVTATGMATEMGAIATLLDETVEAPTPLQREVARIGRRLGIAVVVIALLVVATILGFSDVDRAEDLVTVLLLGVSLAVAAVPEGLPAILSLVLALGVQRMAARRAVVKNLSSVETLGAATVICSDKTGTLTRSQMTLERIVTVSGESRLTGVGYDPSGTIEPLYRSGSPEAAEAEHIVVLGGGTLASNADLRNVDGMWEIQGDPTEAAFLVAEKKLGLDERRRSRFDRVREIPFTSERRMMSAIERDHEHGDELVLVTKGAPAELIALCNRVRVGMEVLPLDVERRRRALDDVERLSDEALRTLSVAYRPISPDLLSAPDDALERDLIFVGTVGIFDPPREEAAAAIADARRAGIRVIMITGDHPRTAARIAGMLGIAPPDAAALTGADLDAMDEARFREVVRSVSVFARVAPVHKLRIVDALQADDHVVAMTGDGVNDAPALKSADIGIAMGITGTEVTRESARMILADDNFVTIVAAVREGRAIYANIRKFLRYLLSSNMGEVLTVFLGVIGAGVIGLAAGADGALVLPLLATQILWINLITDSGPALAMGVDPPADDVMSRPPRRPDEHAIDGRMWLGVIEIGLVMALVSLLAIDLHLPGGLIEGEGDIELARTAGFTVLVLAQLFNAINARSETASAFRGLLANRWLWGAILVSALLQVAVVHLPLLNTAFGTVPLAPGQWLACIALGSVVLWFSELRKWLLRRGEKPSEAALQA